MKRALRLIVLVPALLAQGEALANAQLDRQYALERIAFLKAWDNVDGLFVPYIERAYSAYFREGTRFQLMDASKAGEVLNDSKLPYRELIEDKTILAQVAKSIKAESLIRTKVLKEGPHYRFTVDWLHTPKMTLIASHQFSIEHRAEDQGLSPAEIEAELAKAVNALIGRLPFVAHVTGRDREWVTVSTSAGADISKGDTLLISTVEEVKVHPILQTIVDWKMDKVGSAVVDNVDGNVIFAKVAEEEPGRQISRYQKIVKVLRPATDPAETVTHIEMGDSMGRSRMFDVPKLGWFTAGPWVGGSSRQFGNGTRTVSGSGLLFGGIVEGQVWLNRQLFLDAGFGYGFNAYSQEDVGGGGLVEVDQTVTKWRIGMGYTYLLTDDFYGPKGWAKIGFQSASYGLPSSSVDLTGPATFSGIYFGIGGDLPIRGAWGAILDFEIGLFNGVNASGFVAGGGEGVSSMHFFFGGYYRLTPRLAFRGGLDVQANGSQFGAAEELTQRVMSFVPSVVYSF